MKVVSVKYIYLPQKLIGYHSNVPWTNVRFIIRTNRTTDYENVVKIGPAHSEIFGGNSHFLPIVQKVAILTLLI